MCSNTTVLKGGQWAVAVAVAGVPVKMQGIQLTQSWMNERISWSERNAQQHHCAQRRIAVQQVAHELGWSTPAAL